MFTCNKTKKGCLPQKTSYTVEPQSYKPKLITDRLTKRMRQEMTRKWSLNYSCNVMHLLIAHTKLQLLFGEVLYIDPVMSSSGQYGSKATKRKETTLYRAKGKAFEELDQGESHFHL